MIINQTHQIVVIIPSFNPDQKLLNLLENLKKSKISNIILINDGSELDKKCYFDEAQTDYGCHIITHHLNLGKGRALKSGFNYILKEFPDCVGVITIDSDGQHSANDVINCADALIIHPHCLIMGCRNFYSANVPFTNKMGNIITSKLMNCLCGIKLSDTQTGLRGIPMELISNLLIINGERFEYEMNMLIYIHKCHVEIFEVPIETIYIENNQTSHFHPFIDSIHIYSVFLKFLFSSLSSFVIDITFFSIFVFLFKKIMPIYYIFISTIGARVISSTYNFIYNKKMVFKDLSHSPRTILKYFTLCILQLLLSAFCVNIIVIYSVAHESIIKIAVDCMLFFISFLIQQKLIFNKEGK